MRKVWKFITFDLPWFAYYLVTEPFRELKWLVERKAKEVSSPKKLLTYMFGFFIAGLLTKNDLLTKYSFAVMIITFLAGEYRSGKWRRVYRNRMEKKIGLEYSVNKPRRKN